MNKDLFKRVIADKEVLIQVLGKDIEQIQDLVKIIEEKDVRITELESRCTSYSSEVTDLQNEIDVITEEGMHFKSEVERLFLTDKQEFVWDVETNTLEVRDLDK